MNGIRCLESLRRGLKIAKWLFSI